MVSVEYVEELFAQRGHGLYQPAVVANTLVQIESVTVGLRQQSEFRRTAERTAAVFQPHLLVHRPNILNCLTSTARETPQCTEQPRETDIP